jgi:hypothetical protein
MVENTGVVWRKPYPKDKPEELQVYAECVIDGIVWTINPDGRRVGVLDNPTDYAETNSSGVTKVARPVKPRESTTPQDLEPENETFVTPRKTIGRPRKDIDTKTIEKLAADGLGIRQIARQVKTSTATVSRIVSGQRRLL